MNLPAYSKTASLLAQIYYLPKQHTAALPDLAALLERDQPGLYTKAEELLATSLRNRGVEPSTAADAAFRFCAATLEHLRRGDIHAAA